jgi:hypothetical protein
MSTLAQIAVPRGLDKIFAQPACIWSDRVGRPTVPDFRSEYYSTAVTILGPMDFDEMGREDRIKISDSERFDIAMSQVIGKRLTFAELTDKVGETEFLVLIA